MFIDTHFHLEFFDDVAGLVERATKAGVGLMVAQGMAPQMNRTALKGALEFKKIKAAMGLYPCEGVKLSSDELKKEIDFIRENKDKIVMIGEVGLDLKELDSLEKQKEVFRRMIELAKELGKPICIHSRKAEKEAVEILEELGAKKVVMHCFMGKMSLVERILKNGWYLSIPTSVVFMKHFQEVVKMAPLGQVVCETDAPFLHPEKKYPNEPANVVASYRKIAELKGLALEEVEKEIEGNWEKLFKV